MFAWLFGRRGSKSRSLANPPLEGIEKQLTVGAFSLHIERQLAQGGFAFVYQAKDTHGNIFALKKVVSGSVEYSAALSIDIMVDLDDAEH